MDALPSRVRAFVLGSAGSTPGALRSYYVNLPLEAWLIELARAHGRALRGAWAHDEFAAWIGLRGEELGADYRRMLKRDEPDREELTQLARRLLKCADETALIPLQRSPEMLRFRRAREATERRYSSMGRPCVEQDTTGLIGKQLERWRLALRLDVETWATGLGCTGLTYKNRLAKEKAPAYRDKLTELAKAGAQRYAQLAAPVVARYDVVTAKELTAAYAILANDLENLREELLREGAVPAEFTIDQSNPEAPFLPLDLYSWLRAPKAEDEEIAA